MPRRHEVEPEVEEHPLVTELRKMATRLNGLADKLAYEHGLDDRRVESRSVDVERRHG